MSRKIDTTLDDCMDLLWTGASAEDCLARYPEHAEELRPLVSLASAVKRIPTPRPDPATVQANRLRMLDAIQKTAVRRQRRRPTALGWVWGLSGGLQARPLVRTALALTAVILLVSLAAGALLTVAADSLPGQALYPVKRLSENVRLSLTLNPAARQGLQAEYLLERQREVRRVLDAGQQTVLEFRAALEEIGDGYWVIGGLRVVLGDDTLVQGQAAVGATVIVRASSSRDGTLRALKLQILTNPMLLTVTIPATPTPTPSATPVMTPTPSATPTATGSPSPTATFTPTHAQEPEPTDLPEENETEEPESTDRPDEDDTDEPEPTDYPGPTSTGEP